MKVKSLSHVWLFATPWTVAYQSPPSMGFSRQEYRSGLRFPSSGHLPDPGIKPRTPTLQADALPSEPPGKPYRRWLTKQPQRKEEHEDKVVIWGVFTSSWRTKRNEKLGREGKAHPIKRRVPKKSWKRQEGLLQWTVLNNKRKQQKGKD